MGDLTRDQMVTEICDAVGKSVNATAISGTDLQTRVRTYYLNWAQQRLARYYSFHELTVKQEAFVTVANQKSYTFSQLGLVRPKDIGSVLLIDGYNSRRLQRLSRVYFERKFPRPENYAYGRPRAYVRIGDSIDLFFIPDAVYATRIIYPQWPTPFTTANQVSDYENKDQLLIVTGIMETYLALEEYNDASVWMNKMMGMLNDAMKVEGDVDWSPQAEPIDLGTQGSMSGTPWSEPGATVDDPMYGYPYA